jgi:hypothetical protein
MATAAFTALVVAAVAADFTAEATMVIVGKPTRPDQLFITSVDDLTPLGNGGTVLDTGKPHSDLQNLCEKSTSKFPSPKNQTHQHPRRTVALAGSSSDLARCRPFKLFQRPFLKKTLTQLQLAACLG